jgi:glycerol uptake facilitator-like aquaporin
MVMAALAVAITFGGKISGGHFNPAVTAYQFLAGRVSKNRALAYVGAQLSAAAAVGLIARLKY